MRIIKIKRVNIYTYRSAYRACWQRKQYILSFDYDSPYGIKFKYQSNFWKDKTEQDNFKVIYFICG